MHAEKAGDDDDGNAPTAMVSDFWWRADVSMEDITIARDELRKECTGEGGEMRVKVHTSKEQVTTFQAFIF